MCQKWDELTFNFKLPMCVYFFVQTIIEIFHHLEIFVSNKSIVFHYHDEKCEYKIWEDQDAKHASQA